MNGDEQENRGLRRAKGIAVAAIVLVGVWALWPERESGGGVRGDGGSRVGSADARYVIKFSPGPQYFPGSHPFGMGRPLQGLREVVRAFEDRFPDTRVEVLNTPRVREYLVTALAPFAGVECRKI